ncbi:MAG: hypothetical protein KAI79_02050, partial [Bacteroidales bacterium]|nr:hypothetical protein [Bacteroidales bacterium]
MSKINENIQGNKTMTMNIFFQWTLAKIETNPQLFGGDNGNPAIIKEYLTEMHGKTNAEDLTLSAISQSVGVSRDR